MQGMVSINYDRLFATIEELVMHHSPSGVEQAIDKLLLERFRHLGREVAIGYAMGAIVLTHEARDKATKRPGAPIISRSPNLPNVWSVVVLVDSWMRL